MHSFTLFVVILPAILSVCHGAAFSPPECVGDIKEFPNCEKADAIARKCSNLPKQETIKCFCTQDLLNAYVGCKGEFRQCALGNSFDSASDDQIALWQDTCGPYLPKDITTPVAPTATRTLDDDACKSAVESCAQLSQSITSCSSAYTKPAELTSCRCQESLVSLASACDVNGRQSCVGVMLTTSNIWEFRNCEAATSILQSSKVDHCELYQWGVND
ncbi:hypothetical protein CH063_00571 [Colletotrichum higginsianum]|uniref:Extracellular membrane protein CFEM domain-containing protein n=1 Tax=Colletotrichum higginsianum (strain IMI 349063) TaxID=759273 RepID=H1VZR5_COLHI|nr:hypothetical protein CH63R_01556 [Colletotrichum higginsianum IMI 349063]OBR16376.1 hypothetical protein CH63R_01556 [Colletotrichum higginsianum IMI 349063]GJC91381.1 hypothetical protein ColKHC_00207 [Colletotrichum higginsianum]CCF45727.1 hypothetical protein CH063_00571 [Colletotrichum higginsianum]